MSGRTWNLSRTRLTSYKAGRQNKDPHADELASDTELSKRWKFVEVSHLVSVQMKSSIFRSTKKNRCKCSNKMFTWQGKIRTIAKCTEVKALGLYGAKSILTCDSVHKNRIDLHIHLVCSTMEWWTVVWSPTWKFDAWSYYQVLWNHTLSVKLQKHQQRLRDHLNCPIQIQRQEHGHKPLLALFEVALSESPEDVADESLSTILTKQLNTQKIVRKKLRIVVTEYRNLKLLSRTSSSVLVQHHHSHQFHL